MTEPVFTKPCRSTLAGFQAAAHCPLRGTSSELLLALSPYPENSSIQHLPSLLHFAVRQSEQGTVPGLWDGAADIPPWHDPLLRGLLSVLQVQPRSGCSMLLTHTDGQPHPGRVPRHKLWHKIKSTALGGSWQPLQSRFCLTDVHFRNYQVLTQT